MSSGARSWCYWCYFLFFRFSPDQVWDRRRSLSLPLQTHSHARISNLCWAFPICFSFYIVMENVLVVLVHGSGSSARCVHIVIYNIVSSHIFPPHFCLILHLFECSAYYLNVYTHKLLHPLGIPRRPFHIFAPSVRGCTRPALLKANIYTCIESCGFSAR